MLLQEILRAKGSALYSTRPQASLEEVVHSLVKHNCGSLLVCEGGDCGHGRLVGIITERDILRACAKHGPQLEGLVVADVMTRDVITATPSDSVEDTMGLMTDRRVRHLPIVDGNELVGIISIGDVVKAQHDALCMENHYLKTYIHS